MYAVTCPYWVLPRVIIKNSASKLQETSSAGSEYSENKSSIGFPNANESDSPQQAEKHCKQTIAQHNHETDSSGKDASVGAALSFLAFFTAGEVKTRDRERFSWDVVLICLHNFRNFCIHAMAFSTWFGSMYSNL